MDLIKEVFVTNHGKEREKERAGLSGRRAKRQFQLALERGKRMEDFHSSMERDYLKNRTTDKTFAIVYNRYCYIVSDENVVITVFAVPRWFGKKKNFDGKTRIRNIKKYERCYA